MKLIKNKDFLIGSSILSIYLFWWIYWFFRKNFVLGTFSRPYLPDFNIRQELVKPFSEGYFLGTDIYGRSLFEVLSTGLNYTLFISIVVSLSCIVIGTFVGYLSVRSPGLTQKVLDMITNLIFIFPSILIAIVIMSIAQNSVIGLLGALIFTGWPAYARIVRGEVMRVMGLSYVEGSIAVGVSEFRLLFTAIIPAIFPQLLIHFSLGMGGVILSEASLGFLGLGGSEFSWGYMLSMSKNVLLEAPFMVILLSLVMAGLIISLNLIGDGLRDYFDPTHR